MNQLPTELKFVIFSYAASSPAQVAKLELVSKAFATSTLFSQSQLQLNLWHYYCTKALGYTIDNKCEAAISTQCGFLTSLADCKLLARENLFSFARQVLDDDAIASMQETSDGYYIDGIYFYCLLCAPTPREVDLCVKVQRFIAKGTPTIQPLTAVPASTIAALDAVPDPLQKEAGQNILMFDSFANVGFKIHSLDVMESKGGSCTSPLQVNEANCKVATNNCYAVIVALDSNQLLFEESLKRAQVLLKRIQLYKNLFVTPTVVISVVPDDQEQQPAVQQQVQAMKCADDAVKTLAENFNVPYYAVGKLPSSASSPPAVIATVSNSTKEDLAAADVLNKAISKCCELGAQYTAYAEIAVGCPLAQNVKSDEYKQKYPDDTSFNQYPQQMKNMVTEYMKQHYDKWYPQANTRGTTGVNSSCGLQ